MKEGKKNLNLAEVREQQLNSIVEGDDEHACN
jgi:hypothetical protein